MNFAKGLMLTCGAAGAVLSVVAVTELSVGFKSAAPGMAETVPEIVTLAPVMLQLGPGRNQVQISLRLTVPGPREQIAVCSQANWLTAATARVISDLTKSSDGAGGTVPQGLERVLRARIAAIVGDRVLEGITITVTPAGATPPAATCS